MARDSAGQVCRRVFYTGRVQGVGFRYTAEQIAIGFEVAGFVRNLPDGRVEMVVQASHAESDRFLAAVQERMRDNIDGVEIEQADATDEFDSFRIAH